MESYTTELLPTTKNRPSLVVNGYQHRLHRKNVNVLSWVCTKQKKDRCRGCVKTDLNHKVIRMTPHVCVTNTEEIELKKTIEKLKRRVRDDIHSPVTEIFKEEICDQVLDNISEKPQFSSIKSTLNRLRRKVLGQKLNSWLPDNSEESNPLLCHENPEQVECADDYHSSQLMEENHFQDVQTRNTNSTFKGQKRRQYSPGQQKFPSSENSPEHIECSVDFLPSQFSVDAEENSCQGVRTTDANKNLETLKNQLTFDEKFIKIQNSHKHVERSETFDSNQFRRHNFEKNKCQDPQVVDENINVSKKRKLNSQAEQIEEPASMVLPETTQKDEFHVFGDYVASELRKLSPRALVLAKHNINNILFEANIGNYDSPSASTS